MLTDTMCQLLDTMLESEKWADLGKMSTELSSRWPGIDSEVRCILAVGFLDVAHSMVSLSRLLQRTPRAQEKQDHCGFVQRKHALIDRLGMLHATLHSPYGPLTSARYLE